MPRKSAPRTPRAPEPAPPRRRPKLPTGARTFLLDVPFELRAVAWSLGARWDADLRANVYVGSTLPGELLPFRNAPFSWERFLEDELNGTSTQVNGTGEIALRPHQLQAVGAIQAAHRLGRPGFLLADDVGLGKTAAALTAALELSGVQRILIVCPLAVVPHWRRTIQILGSRGKRIVVVNYDRLKQLLAAPASATRARRVRTKNRLTATRGTARQDFDVVIADESHKLRNVQSQRSAAFRQISKAGRSGKGAFVLWLSATAGQNPLELAYLSPLLAAVTGAKISELTEFEEWCKTVGISVRRGSFGSWEWEPNSADLDKMRRLLFEGTMPAGLRRRPDEIAGWPKMPRIPWPVALERDDRRLYEEVWTRFRRELDLAAKGKDSRNALVAQMRFRQKASLLRVPGTVALVQDLLEKGVQVAVSVVWKETLERIQERLAEERIPCAVLHGDLGVTEREAQRLRFQRGEVRVICFTLDEGFSLHAGERTCGGNAVPRVTIAADPKWSAIQALQVEGRCHRDGQRAPCYYLYAEDTVEEKIVGVVMQRVAAMKRMVGDDPETIREIEAVLRK